MPLRRASMIIPAQKIAKNIVSRINSGGNACAPSYN